MKSTIVIVAVLAVATLAGPAGAQTIECDGSVCGSSGSRDYYYKVTNPSPQLPESVYVGAHDPDPLNYHNILMPSGWTFNILKEPYPDYSGFTSHGAVSPGPDGVCPYVIEWIGPPATTVYLGFDHSGDPHNVSWEQAVSGAPSATSNWLAPVGLGAGPVHGPPCDSCYLYGDVDGNGVNLSTSDLIYLTNYINFNGPPPDPLCQGDLNGDCVLDQGDIDIFEDYFIYGISVFSSYPVPTCCYPTTIWGACCEDDTCYYRSMQNCEDAGGTYLGDGIPCVLLCTDTGITPPAIVTYDELPRQVPQPGTLAACTMVKTDNTHPYWAYSGFKYDDRMVTYFDPATCPGGGSVYPFLITSVAFTLSRT